MSEESEREAYINEQMEQDREDEHRDDDDDDDDLAGECQCNGNGWIVFCIDDICRGCGECMHGDGMRPCPCQF